MTKKRLKNKFLLEQLEQRLLFSADFEPIVLESGISADTILIGSSVEETALLPRASSSNDTDSAEHKRQEILFVDSGISDYRQLVNDLLTRNDDGRSIEVVVLDINKDGIMQLSETLGNYKDLDAVHIVSHGDDGAVRLGNDWLMKETLDDYASSIEGWKQALNSEADILFYGCDLAAGKEGRALIDSLTILTGADVAASDDLTGSSELNGDWELEYTTGKFETGVAFSNEVRALWHNLLAVATDPTEVRVNPNAATTQTTAFSNSQAVASDASGRYVVVWEGEDSDQQGIYARLFDADGTALTGEIQVNTYETNKQRNPSVAMAPDGRFVVSWQSKFQDLTSGSIHARRFDATGAPLDVSDFQIDEGSNGQEDNAYVEIRSNGEFAVAWDDGGDIKVRRFQWDKTPIDVTAITINATGGGNRENPAVAYDDSGGFVVSWDKKSGSDWDVFARNFDNNGTPLSNEILINATSAGQNRYSTSSTDGAGNFTVAWANDSVDGEGWAVLYRQFKTNGTPVTANDLQANTFTASDQLYPSIAMDSIGKFVISWSSDGQDGDKMGVYARQFTPNGIPVDSVEFQVNTTTDNDQSLASMSLDDSGQLVVVWSGNSEEPGQVDDAGVFARRFDAFSLSNNPPAAITLDNTTVDENTAGAVIGNLSTTDPDSGDTHTYTLNDARFEVVAGQLKLKAGQSLDYEAEPTVDIIVTSTDSGGLSRNRLISITVNDLNELPTGIFLDNTTVDENDAGSVIGNLTTTDPDAGNTHTYTVNDVRFEVVAGQLKLKAGQGLNYETESIVNIMVTSSDSGGLSINRGFVITVNNKNETPTAIALDNTDVDENAAGAVIGNLSTTDPDSGDTHTYTVDDVRFEVVAGQLKLKAGQSLDRETEPAVDVAVTSTDAGLLSTNQLFTITVNNVNETPTAIALDNLTVDENASGVVIGNLSTTDPDSGDTHTYTVDDVRFEVVAGQLKLKAGQSLDRETEPTVDVTVTSTDAGLLSTNQLFTITVNNVNEIPTGIALDNTDVDENAAGAVIGNLSTTDPDSGDTHTYTVDDVRFEVVAGQLKLKAGQSLDRETEPTVDVTVTSTDAGLLSTNQLFTITVNNVNETPTGIALDNLTVDENASGVVIGNLSTTDPDAGDSHTYTVDDVRFEVVAGQLKLKAGQSLDRETEPTVDVTVTSTDAGLLNTNQLFTITVNNVNEIPTGIALDNTDVDENATGAVIGNLTTTDPDSGDTHTYTVDDVRFEVVAGQLKLKAGQSLDRETEPTVDVTVTSTDAGLLSTNQLFTITVNNVNETPTAIALDNLTVDENDAGAVIGNTSTTDPDAGDTHTYTVDDARFEVVAGQLKLKAGQSLDRETEPTVDVTVTSTDAGLLSTNQLFTITVNNVNETPTAIALDNTDVDENATGAVIGNLTSTDPDSGDTHTYTVDDVRFEVVAGQLKLKAGQSLDFETEQTVNITVTSSDAGLLSTNQGFIITVNPLNDNTSLALADSITVSQGGTATVLDSSNSSVLVNDSDADLPGDSLTVVLDTAPNFTASFTLNNDGTFIYTHDGSANFSDSFSYYINDGTNISNTVTVSIAITTDLVLHYTLDDGGGFSVNDSSVNNHDGTLIGDLGWTGGDINGALEFDYTDATDDYVEAPNSAILDNVNEGNYTLSAWFRPDSVPTGINPSDNDYEYSILVKQGNHLGLSYTKDQKFHFTHRDSVAGAINIFSTNTFAPGTFYHVVGIVDVATGSMELFINGQSEGTANFAPNPGQDLGTGTWKVGIAAPGAAIYRWAADGVADDVRIYNRTLNASEISTLHAMGNDAPSGIALDNTDVDENAAGTVIGNLSTTDPDSGDTHTYTVDDVRFEVVAGQLKLKAGQSLDRETEPTVDVTVTSTDAGLLNTNQLFTITVNNVNEIPTGIALDNTDVDENATGAVIGNLTTTDPDSGDTHTYTVDDVRFEVVAGQLKLKAGQSLDRETEPTVDVTATSTDAGLLSTNQLFTITVNNVNEIPTGIALDNTDVDENAAGAVIGNLTTTDPDAGDSHTYTVDDVRFEVVAGELKLKAGQSLDRETEPTVDVTVTSTDAGLLNTNQLFTITVNNVNEIPTGIALDNTDVDENATGAVIGNLTTTDPDSGDSHSYTVDDVRFEVVGGQLKLKAGQSLDRETEPTVDVTVTSTDAGLLSTNQLFTITVNNVNEIPTGIALDNTDVDENAAGAVIGNLSTTDPDAGDTHTYTVDDVRFEVVAGELKLKAGQSLDRETEPTVDVTVTSTDAGLLSTNQLFTITVNNVNEIPTVIALDNTDVDENATGAVIGNLTTTDPDSGDTHTYTVDDVRFEVVAGQLKLKAGQSLDRETEPTVDVTVTSTDAGLLNTNQLFTITVNNVNEIPTGIALDNTDVDENATGAVIGNLTTTDPDSGDSHSYTVDDVRFEVVGGQLKLKTGQSLNYETEPTVDVTVTSNDAGMLSTNQLFTITINNVNETPTAIALDNMTVNENAAGAVIGNLSTTDPDSGDSHTYALSDVRFEVVAGQLKLKAGQSLDHETEAVVNINVTSTDSGGLSISRLFNVTVNNDLNEAPTGIALDSTTVDENAAGALVGNLSTTDPDSGDSHTYSVNDALFEVVGSQLKLKAGQSFNYEAESIVSITVTSTDAGGLSTNRGFIISVNDVNEAPSGISLDNTSVDENSAGALIGNLVFTDPDVGDSHTIIVDDARFEIVGGQLKLKAGQSLDRETEPTVNITVTVTDSGLLSASQPFTITVNDANESPTAIDLDNASVDENSSGAIIGNLTTGDPDSGDSHKYSVNDTRFEIVGSKLKLKAGQSLDRETEPTVDVTVTSTDSGGLSISQTFTITVNNVNEAPTGTNLNAPETFSTGTPLNLTDIVVSDVDSAKVTVRLILSDPAAGTLSTATSGSVTSTFNPSNGVWKAKGLITDVNALLAGVVFTPNDGFSSDFTLTTIVRDGMAHKITGIKNMTYIPVADPPADPVPVDELPELEPEAPEEPEEPSEDILPEAPGSSDTGRVKDTVREHSAKKPPVSGSSEGIIGRLADKTRLNIRSIMNDISSNYRTLPFELSTTDPGLELFSQELFNDELLIKTYNRMRDSLDLLKNETANEIQFDKMVVGSTIAASTGLSVGYVIWLIRSGMLLTSVLASLPAWQIADPLPILSSMRGDDDDDDESLEDMLKKREEKEIEKKLDGTDEDDPG